MTIEVDSPVAVSEGSATTESDGEVENEALAQLASDSGDGSDGHLQKVKTKVVNMGVLR